MYVKAGKAIPLQVLERSLGFQEVEAHRFLHNRDMKVVRLSALRTGRLYCAFLLVKGPAAGATDAPQP
jgi:hypothetical protein